MVIKPHNQKIAVLIVGELRTIKYCFQNLIKTHFLTKNTEFFISTWDETSPSKRASKLNSGIKKTKFDLGNTLVTKAEILSLFPQVQNVSIYPKAKIYNMHTEIINKLNLYDICEATKVPFDKIQYDILVTLNQLYLLNAASGNMKDVEKNSGKAFEYVVRTRPDLICRKKLTLPLPGQMIVDSLKRSRRRAGKLFDGYYVVNRINSDTINESYHSYNIQLQQQKLFSSYVTEFTTMGLWGPYSTKIPTIDGSKSALLVHEGYYRYIISLTSLTLMDANVGIKIVR